MKLIDGVREMCHRLAPGGWRSLFEAHGLDILADDLEAELLRPLPGIERGLKGFEDFSHDGSRAIEPGRPQDSLLYHALASPSVRNDDSGELLTTFPTLAELDLLENYVFAAAQRTLDDVTQLVRNAPLSVVVFAVEYRPASETCSRVQADLVFSRTGISRVGTRPPRYDASRRGFLPEDESDPFGIRVLPARYSVYFATQMRGNRREFRPMRYQEGDSSRSFWIPVHKLFDGKECLAGLDMRCRYAAVHRNEKIRRIHLVLKENDVPDSWPYAFSDGIAELGDEKTFGPGLIAPVPHEHLVEEARTRGGNPITYRVPERNGSTFGGFEPDVIEGALTAPEFVHARTEVRDGEVIDLTQDAKHPDVLRRVAAGGYDALHYVDFTGDGFVSVDVSALKDVTGPSQPAYSIVTAPDFFPTCDQRELTEWTTSNALPKRLRDTLWSIPPDTLCDQRLPANLQLPNSPFSESEITITALVPLFGPLPTSRTEPPPSESLRHACLPDDAAGVFAPGWDVSESALFKNGKPTTHHLAAYGLGSPFPEDVKLCAALSSFWPAVAPDATRTMEPQRNSNERSTTVPLTDEEIGREGALPWDGVPGPHEIVVGGKSWVDYPSFMHTDYVRNALAGKFTMRLTARIGAGEYEERALAMALVYEVLGDSRNQWIVLSFKRVSHGDPELHLAQQQAKATLQSPIYFFDVFRYSDAIVSPDDFRRRRVPITRRHAVYCDPTHRRGLIRPPSGTFRHFP